MAGLDYKNQLMTVKRLRVPEGITKRFDCPFCGGHNTLGVSNLGGVLEWHCFKASCTAKGIYNAGVSLETIANIVNSKEQPASNKLGRAIPDLLVDIRLGEHLDYLKSVHALEAYEAGLAPIFYSPSEDRILFSVNRGKGYTGRRIGHYGPKWVKYGDTSHLFTCGTGKTGVLVEDAPSACAVGIIPEYTGLSLLGTNLTNQHKLDLMEYENVIVCLDPDAYNKGLNLVSKINGIRPATAKLIPDDLKYFNKDEIKEILSNIEDK